MKQGAILCVLAMAMLLSRQVQAGHAYAQFGDIKYPAGFPHFNWVNPQAPKRGAIELVAPTRDRKSVV